MSILIVNKKILIFAAILVLAGVSFYSKNSISRLLYFGSDTGKSEFKESPSLPPPSISSTPDILSLKGKTSESIGPRGLKIGKYPPYEGRDPGEFRPVPEEVKLFNEDQKNQIYISIKNSSKKVKERPDFLEDWLQIGILKKMIGDFEGARDSWEYAGVVSPLNSVSFANLGELYWRYLHDYPKSESNFKISIKNKPNDPLTYISFSGLYFYSYKEKQDLADDVLFDGLKANPEDTNLMKALASLYEKQKEYLKSLEWWERVLKNEPNNKDVAKTIEDIRKKIDGLTY